MSATHLDQQQIECVAWQSYADACLEHDGRHGKRAAAEVRGLQPLPRQRTLAARGSGRTLAG